MDILLVDDHTLFRQGLAGLLEQEPRFKVIGQAGCVKDAVSLARSLSPDLILMDFSLPDGTGAEACQKIMASCSSARIVFLTIHGNDEALFTAIRSGAKGYLLKNTPIQKLMASLRSVAEGEPALSPALINNLFHSVTARENLPAEDDRNTHLTFRELEIIQEIATSASNQQIARKLVITENTVKSHVHSILEKLGYKNRREIIQYARQHGLIRPLN